MSSERNTMQAKNKDLSTSGGRQHSPKIWGTLTRKRLTLICMRGPCRAEAIVRSQQCNITAPRCHDVYLISCSRRCQIGFERADIKSWLPEQVAGWYKNLADYESAILFIHCFTQCGLSVSYCIIRTFCRLWTNLSFQQRVFLFNTLQSIGVARGCMCTPPLADKNCGA